MKSILNKIILISTLIGSIAFAQNTGGIVQGDITPGFSSKKNYVINFGAEKNVTTGISAASGTLTRTTSATQVIDGDASFVITPTASNQAVTFLTLPSNQKLAGTDCELSFDVRSQSGTATTGYYAELASGSIVTSAPITVTGSAQDGQNIFVPCSSFLGGTGPASGPTFKIYNTTNVIPPLVVDNIVYGKDRSIRTGTIIVPSITAGVTSIGATTTAPTKGTTSNDLVRYGRVGDQARFIYEYRQTAAGSAGSGEYLFTLPANLRFDSNKTTFFTTANSGAGHIQTPSCLGSIAWSDTVNVSQGTGCIIPFDATRFRVLIVYNNGTSPNRGTWGSTLFPISNGAQSFTADFTAYIEGYQATGTQVDLRCQTDIQCTNNFVFFVSAAGTVTGENLDFINGNCAVASNVFTCTLNSGVFGSAPVCTGVINNSTASRQVRFTSTSASSLVFAANQTGTGDVATDMMISCTRGADFVASKTISAYFSKTMSHTGDSIKREAWATFGGAGSISSPTTCTSSPCTRYKGDSAITGATRGGTGSYAVAITSGAFTDIDSVQLSTGGINNAIHCQWNSISTTVIGVSCSNTSTGAAADWYFSINVKGNR